MQGVIPDDRVVSSCNLVEITIFEPLQWLLRLRTTKINQIAVSYKHCVKKKIYTVFLYNSEIII